MSLGDPTSSKIRRDLDAVLHRGAERVLVAVSGPHLEHLVGVLRDLRLVQDQDAQSLSIECFTMPFCHLLGRIEEKLQRGESLLTIDHMTNGDEACWVGLRVKDDRAQEVWRNGRARHGGSLKYPLRKVCHVGP